MTVRPYLTPTLTKETGAAYSQVAGPLGRPNAPYKTNPQHYTTSAAAKSR